MKRTIVLAVLMFVSTVAWCSDRRIVSRVAPTYPEMAKRMRVAGDVTVKVAVRKDGKVADASAISGHPLLKTAAVNAVKEWVFEPGAEETIDVVITFKD